MDELIEQQNARQDDLNRLALQAQNDMKTVLATASGRRLLRRILGHCDLEQSSFVPGCADVSAFREGRRDVGLWLISQIKAHRNFYLILIAEELDGQSELIDDN
jgi:hypothetical protein